MAKPKKKKDWRNLTIEDRITNDLEDKEQLANRVRRWRERVDEETPDSDYSPAAFEGIPLGTVLNMRSSHHYVRLDDTGEVIDAKIKGILKRGIRNTTTVVAPGDRVHVVPGPDGVGLIVGIVPRKNALSRPDPLRPHLEDIIVANLDQLIIVSSVGGPAFWPELVDRFLVFAEYYHTTPLILINKSDLAVPGELDDIRSLYETQLGYRVLATSVESGEGVEQLKDYMKDKISVVTGLSGVGKSSLLNVIQPGLNLRVRSVNMAYGGEGKHTTRTTTLYPLDIGGYVADTPGIRGFGLWNLTPEEVDYYFIEFQAYLEKCRFSNCSHHQEPQCAIRQAVADGEIAESRYKTFLVLFEETNPALERPF